MDLVPVSTNEFVRVFSDGGGFVHEQGLRFGADVWGRPQVEITDDQGGSIVAVSSNAARFPFALPPVMAIASSRSSWAEWPGCSLADTVGARVRARGS